MFMFIVNMFKAFNKVAYDAALRGKNNLGQTYKGTTLTIIPFKILITNQIKMKLLSLIFLRFKNDDLEWGKDSSISADSTLL